jgi:hypothetical protein
LTLPIFLLLISISAEESSLGIVFLELVYLIQPFLLDKGPQSPTKSDLHDVRFEVVIGEPEVKVLLRVLFYTWDESLLAQLVLEHMRILHHGHSLKKAVVVVKIVVLPLLPQSYC